MTTMSAAFTIQDIAMLGYGAADYQGSNLGTLLDQAALAGANYVTLGSTTEMDLATGAVVSNPSVTTNFSDMGSAIQQAEARGLNVMLDPQVGDANGITFSSPGETLSDPAAFFAQYKAFVLQWAELAQQDHVAILSIGSEMLAATGPQYTSYWDDIIASVRAVYSGKLTYFALESEVSQIGFWNKLDYAGVDVFPDLSSAANPTVAQLNAGWAPTVGALASSVGSLNMPVLFTATGVSSIDGAAAGTSTDGGIGQTGTVTNQQLQENWWQSFFETWSGANKPSWLSGVSVWDNDPNAVNGYAYYQQDYSIYGKPATALITAWFGASDYLQPLQTSFTGTPANDLIKLYGSAAQGAPANQDASFDTVIAIKAHGQVVGGQAPTIDIQINGQNMGTETFSTAQTSVYEGLTYTSDQTFYFSLSGLQKIADLRIVLETADTQCYISSVTVGSTALTQATYTSATGGTQAQTIGSTANQWNQGYTDIDASAWNSGITTGHPGTAALPIQINGGGGTDLVDVLGLPSQYTASGIGTGSVSLSEKSGLDQNAVLNGISYVGFADGAMLNLTTGVLVLTAGSASESFAGMPGQGNVVEFSGKAGQYSVTGSGDGTSFTIGNGTITDHLSGITALSFADYTELVASQTPAVAGAVSSAQVANLYAAVLARVPDVSGLAFYQAAAAAHPATSITTFAQWFLSSPEYTGNSAHDYAQNAAGDAQFITDTYQNLLHRAPEAGAVAFYQSNVIDPIVGNAVPGTTAYAQAELLAHAMVLTYFSGSAEFLGDVQVTAAHPADAQHWLVLI